MVVDNTIPRFKEFKQKVCPRCGGSGTEEVFGYMYGDNQPMPKTINCRVCKGKGFLVERRVKVFGYMYGDNQPMPKTINCRVCGGTGYTELPVKKIR